MGTRTTLGPLVQVELRPGLGRGGGGGAWAWEKRKERQLQVASTLPSTLYMVPCTMQAVHIWRCRVAVGDDVGDVGPALGPSSVRDSSTARRDPYLIACIDPVSPTSAEKGSARGR